MTDAENANGSTGGWSGDGFDVRQLDDYSVVEVAAWPANEAALGQALAGGSQLSTLHVAPGRYWLLDAAAGRHWLDNPRSFATTELTSGLAFFRISGEGARQALAALLPVDLHQTRFTAGDVATTLLDEVTVTVHDCGDGFNLLCRRSFAASLLRSLLPVPPADS